MPAEKQRIWEEIVMDVEIGNSCEYITTAGLVIYYVEVRHCKLQFGLRELKRFEDDQWRDGC